MTVCSVDEGVPACAATILLPLLPPLPPPPNTAVVVPIDCVCTYEEESFIGPAMPATTTTAMILGR